MFFLVWEKNWGSFVLDSPFNSLGKIETKVGSGDTVINLSVTGMFIIKDYSLTSKIGQSRSKISDMYLTETKVIK